MRPASVAVSTQPYGGNNNNWPPAGQPNPQMLSSQSGNLTRATSVESNSPGLADRGQSARPGPITEEPLPNGWEMRRTPQGEVYFLDHSRRRSQWEDPRTGYVMSVWLHVWSRTRPAPCTLASGPAHSPRVLGFIRAAVLCPFPSRTFPLSLDPSFCRR